MADEIYCPRCGTACLPDTSYCRACGLELSEIGAIVRGESPDRSPERFRPNNQLMRLGMGLFILGLVIALGNAAIKNLGMYPEEWGKMLFLLLIMMGMACLGLGIVLPAKRRRKSKRRDQELAVKEASATKQLASAPLFAADAVFAVPEREAVLSGPGSVTERTTRNLE